MSRFVREKKYWILGVVAWAIVSWVVVAPLPSCHCLRVIMFDVGQGDAFAVTTPNNKKMIVDFGPSDLIVSSWQRYFAPADKYIDQAILSHPDLDHIGGSMALQRRYNFQMSQLTTKNSFTIDGAGIKVFSPAQISVADSNNDSSVFKLTFASSSMLFTGDAEIKVEQALLKEKVDLKSEVLKVSHHGSKTGTSLEFLKAVSPGLALISVGADNKYGHPHLEVIKRLAGQKIKTYRTDQLGDVILRSDGKTWSIETKPLWQAWQEWLIK